MDTTTSEQIADFTAFAKTISRQEGEDISLDVIYDRWWQQRHRVEDLAALQEAHVEYETGERGEDAREELSEFRAKRTASNKQ